MPNKLHIGISHSKLQKIKDKEKYVKEIIKLFPVILSIGFR